MDEEPALSRDGLPDGAEEVGRTSSEPSGVVGSWGATGTPAVSREREVFLWTPGPGGMLELARGGELLGELGPAARSGMALRGEVAGRVWYLDWGQRFLGARIRVYPADGGDDLGPAAREGDRSSPEATFSGYVRGWGKVEVLGAEVLRWSPVALRHRQYRLRGPRGELVRVSRPFLRPGSLHLRVGREGMVHPRLPLLLLVAGVLGWRWG